MDVSKIRNGFHSWGQLLISTRGWYYLKKRQCTASVKQKKWWLNTEHQEVSPVDLNLCCSGETSAVDYSCWSFCFGEDKKVHLFPYQTLKDDTALYTTNVEHQSTSLLLLCDVFHAFAHFVLPQNLKVIKRSTLKETCLFLEPKVYIHFALVQTRKKRTSD